MRVVEARIGGGVVDSNGEPRPYGIHHLGPEIVQPVCTNHTGDAVTAVVGAYDAMGNRGVELGIVDACGVEQFAEKLR